MRKSAILAMVAVLALAGCGDSAGNGQSTVTVTGTANARDAATTNGSRVISQLAPGTEITGRWVQAAQGSSDRWFEYETNNGKAYVWEGNISEAAPQTGPATDQAILPPPPKFTAGTYAHDHVCLETEDKKCVPSSQWKAMCDQLTGVTKYAGQIVFAPWAGDPAASYLYDNGGFAGATFKWADFKHANGENGRCVATLSISGTYQGSQVERSKDGAVDLIVVTGDGDIIASSINTYGY
jgi:hypothetical protein